MKTFRDVLNLEVEIGGHVSRGEVRVSEKKDVRENLKNEQSIARDEIYANDLHARILLCELDRPETERATSSIGPKPSAELLDASSET